MIVLDVNRFWNQIIDFYTDIRYAERNSIILFYEISRPLFKPFAYGSRMCTANERHI